MAVDLPATPTYHWKDDRALELIKQGRAVVLLESAAKWTLPCESSRPPLLALSFDQAPGAQIGQFKFPHLL